MTYIFLAPGFEEIEALCPLDLLRRAGVEVKTVGIGGKSVTGSHGITVEADMADMDFSDSNPDLIMLPGGMPGTLNLEASPVVMNAIKNAADRGAYISAICAAPMILGKLGLLCGKKATCYPGFEEYLEGAEVLEAPAVIDGKIITGAGMGAALDFGLLLVSVMCGEDKAAELRRSVIADR